MTLVGRTLLLIPPSLRRAIYYIATSPTYDHHDDDEAFITQLPDEVHDQNYNVKVELGLFEMFIYQNQWQMQLFGPFVSPDKKYEEL